MSKQTMGEFLALLRKANGFTQQDVADKLNISNRTLSSWETDRTTPDILLLPAIADLYGVTVDELLRCERITAENENKEISDKAKNSARKHRLGKFSAKSLLLSCLACFGAVLIALSFIFWMYAGCPTWLFILLIVLSACDIAICGVILFYLYYNAKVAEGLVLKEDYTEEKKPYALALKHKSAIFFLLCALPLVIFAIGMIIATVIIQPTNYEILGVEFNIVGAYVATICTTGGLGIAFLIAYFVYLNTNFISLANEKQAETHKNNLKLLGKTVGFGAIPVAVFMLLMGVLNIVFPTTYSAYISADTPEDFKRQMQTLEITKYSVFNIDCGKPVGKYYLNFPETYEPGLYDLGNGFYGLSNYYVDSETWIIALLKEEGKLPVADENGNYDDSYFYDCHIKCETYYDFGIKYVNVACNYTIYHESVFGLSVDSELKARQYRGKYEFGAVNDIDASLTSFYLFILASGASVITCTAIYFTKRKKQSYEF